MGCTSLTDRYKGALPAAVYVKGGGSVFLSMAASLSCNLLSNDNPAYEKETASAHR
ncbi:MAG: hypothetical protein K0S39_667 [Paenibacillus sp.]|jgi:hypothetical protein|nr:hypothetical protein [Paenibacillus sp.]